MPQQASWSHSFDYLQSCWIYSLFGFARLFNIFHPNKILKINLLSILTNDYFTQDLESFKIKSKE